MKNRRIKAGLNLLTEHQLDALLDLLEGRAALIYIQAVPYALDGGAGLLRFRHLDSEVQYTITSEGCTCPSSRYRGAACKHMEALRTSLFAQQLLGTPVSGLSGRPGFPGYAEFCRIAASWGYP